MDDTEAGVSIGTRQYPDSKPPGPELCASLLGFYFHTRDD